MGQSCCLEIGPRPDALALVLAEWGILGAEFCSQWVQAPATGNLPVLLMFKPRVMLKCSYIEVIFVKCCGNRHHKLKLISPGKNEHKL